MKLFKLVLFASLLMMIGVSSPLYAQGPGDPPPPPPPGQGQGGDEGESPTFDPNYVPVPNTYTGIGTVTQGSATEAENLSLTTDCTTNERFESALSGKVIAEDGSEWIVPMQVYEGLGAVDMFNNCGGSGDNPDYESELQTVVIGEGGNLITGYIFADNYFELYVNGQFVARDTIGFIPFNSSVVQFEAAYPITLAVHLADWETHLGLGMEYDTYRTGDGGFIASFSDGTVTNAEWKCEPLYIAPLDDPACVAEAQDGSPDSSACSSSPICASENAEMCRALHYPLAEDWTSPQFVDGAWDAATIYEASQVTNQPAYTQYAGLFGNAEFIWTPNIDLDNEVVCRLTVEAP